MALTRPAQSREPIRYRGPQPDQRLAPGTPTSWLGNEMRTSILGVIAAIGAFALFGVASPAEADVNITGAGLWGDNTPDTPFSRRAACGRSLLTLRIIRFPRIRQTKLPISLMN